jgi:hypothetical protein
MIITPIASHATVGELVLKIVLKAHAHPWLTQLFVIAPYSLTPSQSTIWLLIRLTAGNIPQRNTAILYITARLGVASSEREHSRHLYGSHKQREMKETHIVSAQPSAASPPPPRKSISYIHTCICLCVTNVGLHHHTICSTHLPRFSRKKKVALVSISFMNKKFFDN